MRTEHFSTVCGIALSLAALAPGCGTHSNSSPGPAARGRDGGAQAGGARGAQLVPLAGTATSGASAALGVHGGSVADSDDTGPPAVCPLEQSDDPDKVLDETSHLLYDVGDLKTALACADVAIDMVPQAVEAHHYRAAALAALGRYPEAQVAFAMALARDPDDPETLAAASDFYVNICQPKDRASVLLGLEYARRGNGRAQSRRRSDRRLRARLALLEGEADNDLGQSDLALPRIDAALKLEPHMVAAVHERGVALFSLCRFKAAEKSFLEVLAQQPDDPYAHYHLGLIYEREGRTADAEAHFQRARTLSPDDFPAPVLISKKAFRAQLDRDIAEEPAEVRKELAGVSIEVVDLPATDDLVAVDPPFAPTILGLYRGLPVGVDDAGEGAGAGDKRARGAGGGEGEGAMNDDLAGGSGDPAAPAGRTRDTLSAATHRGAGLRGRDHREHDVPPRAIVLYRKNLARAVKTRAELDTQIRRTLLHEIGHLQGLDEDQLRHRGLE